jgi:hypothetical protein
MDSHPLVSSVIWIISKGVGCHLTFCYIYKINPKETVKILLPTIIYCVVVKLKEKYF